MEPSFNVPSDRTQRKKWSPVDRMLFDRKNNRTRKQPSVGIAPKKDSSVQTITPKQAGCTDKECEVEKNVLQQEIKELKRRMRELKKKMIMTERENANKEMMTVQQAIVAPPPKIKTPISPVPMDKAEELALAQSKIEELSKENTKLKSTLQNTWARSQQVEMSQREISMLTERQEKDKNSLSVLRVHNNSLMTQLSAKCELIKDLESKILDAEAERDSYIGDLESGQAELVRRVNVLQRQILPSLDAARGQIGNRKHSEFSTSVSHHKAHDNILPSMTGGFNRPHPSWEDLTTRSPSLELQLSSHSYIPKPPD